MSSPPATDLRTRLEKVGSARDSWFLAMFIALACWMVSCSESEFGRHFGAIRCFFPRMLSAYQTPEGIVVREREGDPPPPDSWIEIGNVGWASVHERGFWGRTRREYLAYFREPDGGAASRVLSEQELDDVREAAAVAVERQAADWSSPELLHCAAMMRAGVQNEGKPLVSGWLHNAFSLASGLTLLIAPFRYRVLSRAARRLQDQVDRRCPDCGYDCTGCPAATCPECGLRLLV
jgi:hypothetical protein